jgi:hypothetical protein
MPKAIADVIVIAIRKNNVVLYFFIRYVVGAKQRSAVAKYFSPSYNLFVVFEFGQKIFRPNSTVPFSDTTYTV